MDRSRITAARHELLALHKAIVDAERADLERVEGRLTPQQMLDRLLMDARFEWLRPLTALIVGIDEMLEDEVAEEADAYLVRTVALLTPEGTAEGNPFAREYLRLLHDRAEVTMAHAAVMRVLRN